MLGDFKPTTGPTRAVNLGTINRAALSSVANIAEGNGLFTKTDRRSFFRIARSSASRMRATAGTDARGELDRTSKIWNLEVSARRNCANAVGFNQRSGKLRELVATVK